MRFIALVAILLCASVAVWSQDYDRATVLRLIDERGVDPLAGVWQTAMDASTVAFVPTAADFSHFDIVLLDSHDMSAIPGQVVGSAFATGSPGTYDATFVTTAVKSPLRVILTLDRDMRLSFKPYKQRLKLSLWRLLPYMFRNPVRREDTRPASADAAVRLYPSGLPEGPVML